MQAATVFTEELGDQKPTQLPHRMQQLFSDRSGMTDGGFLKELFLQCLPSNVWMVLASTPDATNLDKLELQKWQTIKIMEVASPSVSAVNMPSPAALASDFEQ